MPVACGKFFLPGFDDLAEECIGEGPTGGKEDAGFRGLERGAVDQRDHAAGMRVKAEMAGKGGIARDHPALAPRLTKAGHGVGQAFDVIGQEGAQGGAQIAEGPALILGQGGKIGIDVRPGGDPRMGRLPILRRKRRRVSPV